MAGDQELWALTLNTPLQVTPTDSLGMLRVSGHRYPGSLRIAVDSALLVIENRVDLETYLRGVVPVELGFLSRATPAALCTQAVISRTYALYQIALRDQALSATVGDQVYAGADAWVSSADDAIRATRGTVIAAGNAPALTLFHSTCAGHTAAIAAVWPNAAVSPPYLSGVSDLDEGGDPYCSWSKYSHWRESWSTHELIKTLRRYLPQEFPSCRGGLGGDPGPIRIEIARRSSDGRVSLARISAWNRDFDLPGERIRWVLRAPGTTRLLRSSKLSRLELRPTGLEIEGEGWGHGLGLCQIGALERAARGSTWQEIVHHYYPGTRIKRLY
jgi:stage II sporulation protein D